MTDAVDLLLLSQADGAALTFGDGLLLVALAGCSLDEKPGSNWVQENGGLPEYICRIARALKRSGHPTSEAVSIAVGTVKNWASGQKGVTPKTRAAAGAAVAQWEALKAKAHAKTAGKDAVKASGETYEFLSLCADTFNTDVVQQAFRSQLADSMFPKKASKYSGEMVPADYSYVQQMWSNFIIATGDLDHDGDTDYYKIPFSVDPTDQTTVTFGTPIEVRQEWVTLDGSKLDGSDDLDASDMTDDDMNALADLSGPLDKFLALAAQKSGPPKPYGDVKYADPKNGKYPIDTEEHARAAWAYINKPKNAAVYPLNGVALSSVKAAIKAAAKRFGIDISGD